jgi:hypothetical protein
VEPSLNLLGTCTHLYPYPYHVGANPSDRWHVDPSRHPSCMDVEKVIWLIERTRRPHEDLGALRAVVGRPGARGGHGGTPKFRCVDLPS